MKMFVKQITFPIPMVCTHINPDGSQERIRYGYYEAIEITKRNGWEFGTENLNVPDYYVEEVTKVDGTIVVLDEPFMLINRQEYGDGSGRKAANRIR